MYLNSLNENKIEEIVRILLPSLQDLFLLEEVPKISHNDSEKLKQELATLIRAINKLEESSKSDHPEQIENSKEIIREIIQLTFRPSTPIPKNVNPFDWIIKALQKGLDNKAIGKYFTGTKYPQYRICIENLSKKAYHSHTFNLVDDFVKKAQGNNEFLPLIQWISHIGADNKILTPHQTRINLQLIRNCMRIYSELSGHYEKYIALILGIHSTIENQKIADYNKIRRNGLAKNLELLKKIPELNMITLGFDIKIRNSIAHNSTAIIPSKRTIDFIDRNTKTNLSYKAFFEKTRELNALVYSLIQYNTIFNINKFIYIKKLFAKNN